MKLTILGANGPYPAANGACSGYLVEDGGAAIALDLGAGALARLLAHRALAELSGVVLSHLHYDHMSDMLPLRYALERQGRTLPVLAPDAPAPVRALLDAPCFAVQAPRDGLFCGLALRFFSGRHPVPSNAVRVCAQGRALVYTGDTNECAGLAAFCDSAALLLADAGLPERAWRAESPHLSARRCGCLAAQARAEQLVLTHLAPDEAPDALLDEARAVFARASLAEPGRVFCV